MLHIDESFLNQTVRVPAGQVIELRLQENPTTGFQWSLAANGRPSCTVISDRFEPHKGPPGAGGEHMWQIKAVHTGICRFKLLYRRPFDPGAPPAGTFAVELQVIE
jgi:inhibitor of cysteine peptidase